MILNIQAVLFKICFPVFLRNRLISGGFEPVLIHTENSCFQNKNHKIITSFVRPAIQPLGTIKTGFNHFKIRGKLSIIRCNKNPVKADPRGLDEQFAQLLFNQKMSLQTNPTVQLSKIDLIFIHKKKKIIAKKKI